MKLPTRPVRVPEPVPTHPRALHRPRCPTENATIDPPTATTRKGAKNPHRPRSSSAVAAPPSTIRTVPRLPAPPSRRQSNPGTTSRGSCTPSPSARESADPTPRSCRTGRNPIQRTAFRTIIDRRCRRSLVSIRSCSCPFGSKKWRCCWRLLFCRRWLAFGLSIGAASPCRSPRRISTSPVCARVLDGRRPNDQSMRAE